MRTKQTIAIIGATGSMGAAIAKAISKGNYHLLLSSGNFQRTQDLVNEINTLNPFADVEAMDCLVNAGWEADMIILAVPYPAEKETAQKIKEVANQKIVISISNPLNENYNGLLTEPGTSAAEQLQALLPNSKVVKAFNTNFAADFATPVIDGLPADTFIAGNDKEMLDYVEELVSIAGFNPIIAGNLSMSGILESMQLLMIRLNIENNYNGLAGWKILHQ
jgi:hypothetical protein